MLLPIERIRYITQVRPVVRGQENNSRADSVDQAESRAVHRAASAKLVVIKAVQTDDSRWEGPTIKRAASEIPQTSSGAAQIISKTQQRNDTVASMVSGFSEPGGSLRWTRLLITEVFEDPPDNREVSVVSRVDSMDLAPARRVRSAAARRIPRTAVQSPARKRRREILWQSLSLPIPYASLW